MTTSAENRSKSGNTPLFPLGQVVATPGAIEALEKAGEAPSEYLSRHVRGDWGTVCQEDAELNDQAIRDEARILSAYRLSTGARIWVLTEADRSVTTILLPSEY